MKFQGTLENSLNKERLKFEKVQSMFRKLKCRVCVWLCLFVRNGLKVTVQ